MTMNLNDYVRALETSQYLPDMNLTCCGKVRSKIMSAGLREKLQLMATRLIYPWAIRRARHLLRAQPLRLHLGSGRSHLAGWTNIDLLGLPIELPWDLRKRLPFPDGCADAIFHEHLLEHLPLAAVLPLLRECRRVMRPGGIIRIGVPDAGRYAHDVAMPSGFIDSVRPARPTRLLALAELAYCYGHRSLWDGETLLLVLRESGFDTAEVKPFGASAIKPTPDSKNRADESVYVEALKPATANPKSH